MKGNNPAKNLSKRKSRAFKTNKRILRVDELLLFDGQPTFFLANAFALNQAIVDSGLLYFFVKAHSAPKHQANAALQLAVTYNPMIV